MVEISATIMKFKFTIIPLNIDVKHFLAATFNKALGNHPMQIADIQKININPAEIEGIQHLPEVVQTLIFNEAVFYQISNNSHIMTAIVALFDDEGKQMNMIIFDKPKCQNLK